MNKIIYLITGLLFFMCPALAEPLKVYKVIIPFSAGGASDVMFRFIEPALNIRLKKHDIQLVVENVPGAAGAIGLSKVINSTRLQFGFFSPFFAINKNIRNDFEYDFDSVKFLSFAGYNKMVILSGRHVDVASLQNSCDKSKSISFGSSGLGSTSHLASYYFAKKYLKCNSILSVPYKGVSSVYPDLKAGRIDFMADFAINVDSFIQTKYFNYLTDIKDTELLSWHILIANLADNQDAEIVKKEFDLLKTDNQFISQLTSQFHVYKFEDHKNIVWLKNEFDSYKRVIDSLPKIQAE